MYISEEKGIAIVLSPSSKILLNTNLIYLRGVDVFGATMN